MKGGDRKRIARRQAPHIDLRLTQCSCTNTARTLETLSIHIECFLAVPAPTVWEALHTLCKHLVHLKGCSWIKNNFCSLVIEDYEYLSRSELGMSDGICLNVNAFSSSKVVTAVKKMKKHSFSRIKGKRVRLKSWCHTLLLSLRFACFPSPPLTPKSFQGRCDYSHHVSPAFQSSFWPFLYAGEWPWLLPAQPFGNSPSVVCILFSCLGEGS